MEVKSIILSLALYGRIYSGMTAEEGEACALKAVEIAGDNADTVDLIDAFDDVWAASLLAGTINESENSTPMHPLKFRERLLNSVKDKHDRDHIASLPDSAFDPEPKRPARYKNKNFVAIVKDRNKKKRHWDKGV